MAEHTPGPWHVTAGPYPREIRADDGPFIASVYDLGVTYGERNANARLLAAAPELLDALKEAADWIATHGDTLPASAMKLSAVLTAAIAKATAKAER